MAIHVQPLSLPECLAVTVDRFGDDRGWFSETYNRAAFSEAGIDLEFVQDNVSLSSKRGTVRGLHFQAPPFAQAKLVRVLAGSLLDVAVDIRVGSPTFGQHVAIEMTARDLLQVFIPEGFAHGFCTLEDETTVQYKVTSPYSPSHDHGLLWSDPEVGIPWPVAPNEAVLSERDQTHPTLRKLPTFFGVS